MYDIKPLEEQWERYNKKRKKPLYRLFWIFAFFAALGVFAFLNQDLIKNTLGSYSENNTAKAAEKTNAFPVALDGPLRVLAEKNASSEASPGTAALKNASQEEKEVQLEPAAKKNNNPMDPEDVFVDTPSPAKKQKTKKKKAKKEVKKKAKKKLHIEVIETTGMSAYKVIEERFKAAPDSDDALFLARGYFAKGNYKKAAYWALQTNKLDGDIEESWLLFARAKTKIGQKNEAIRVLTEYTKKSHSQEAYKLLQKLKQ